MTKRLCVYVPGLTGDVAAWQPLIDKLSQEEELKGSLWVPFEHLCSPFGRRRAIDAARELRVLIDAKWLTAEFDEIILIGHSMGGLLVRQAYLLSAGIYPNEPSEAKWHAAVTRIVLLASINRGIDPQRSARTRTAYQIAKLLFWRRVFLKDLLRGSDFVTELRLQWIRHFRTLPHRPQVVQLLGNDDKEVSRVDSIDVVQFPGAGHITVPGASHVLLHRLDATPDPAQHYALIRQGVLGEFEDETVPLPAEKTVVFLMHGIRAYSVGWVTRLKSEVEEEARCAERPVTVVAPQRHLSALQFVVPWLHARLVRWFQDEYSQLFASNPKGSFVFAGHSNGTYLLGRSIEAIRAMRFGRIYLAGSVLPTGYCWRDRFQAEQAERVRNDCTTGDVPVGVLCRALSWLGRNVGTGGVHGFDHADSRLRNYRYFPGGHGTVLNDAANRRTVVEFLIHGTLMPDPPTLRPAIPLPIDWLQKLCSVAILALVAAGLFWSVYAFPVGLLWFLGIAAVALLVLSLA